jgi:hypothetical protein
VAYQAEPEIWDKIKIEKNIIIFYIIASGRQLVLVMPMTQVKTQRWLSRVTKWNRPELEFLKMYCMWASL